MTYIRVSLGELVFDDELTPAMLHLRILLSEAVGCTEFFQGLRCHGVQIQDALQEEDELIWSKLQRKIIFLFFIYYFDKHCGVCATSLDSHTGGPEFDLCLALA